MIGLCAFCDSDTGKLVPAGGGRLGHASCVRKHKANEAKRLARQRKNATDRAEAARVGLGR